MRRPARFLALAALALASLAETEAKGGGMRMRSSSARSSRSRTSSGSSSNYRAQPMSGCRNCYYSNGGYYHRSYFIYYGGMSHQCYSCASHPGDTNDLTMSIPAVNASIHVFLGQQLMGQPWTLPDLLSPGSATYTNFTGAVSADISALYFSPVPGTAVTIDASKIAISSIHAASMTSCANSVHGAGDASSYDPGASPPCNPVPATTALRVDFTIMVLDLGNDVTQAIVMNRLNNAHLGLVFRGSAPEVRALGQPFGVVTATLTATSTLGAQAGGGGSGMASFVFVLVMLCFAYVIVLRLKDVLCGKGRHGRVSALQPPRHPYNRFHLLVG